MEVSSKLIIASIAAASIIPIHTSAAPYKTPVATVSKPVATVSKPVATVSKPVATTNDGFGNTDRPTMTLYGQYGGSYTVYKDSYNPNYRPPNNWQPAYGTAPLTQVINSATKKAYNQMPSSFGVNTNLPQVYIGNGKTVMPIAAHCPANTAGFCYSMLPR